LSVERAPSAARSLAEPLIKAIYKHIKAQQVEEQAPVYIDPRFVEAKPE
jgi:GTP-binding protein